MPLALGVLSPCVDGVGGSYDSVVGITCIPVCNGQATKGRIASCISNAYDCTCVECYNQEHVHMEQRRAPYQHARHRARHTYTGEVCRVCRHADVTVAERVRVIGRCSLLKQQRLCNCFLRSCLHACVFVRARVYVLCTARVGARNDRRVLTTKRRRRRGMLDLEQQQVHLAQMHLAY